MRVLVYPHKMEIGGSQLNALELASAMQKRGHEVVVYGARGELSSALERLELEHLTAASEKQAPSPRNMLELARVTRRRAIDILHGYEAWPTVNLGFGPHARWKTPLVGTVMSMNVPPFLPRHAPMLVGTEELVERQRRIRPTVHLLEPPIDTDANSPSDPKAARARFGLQKDETVVAVICRLTTDLQKLEGVLSAISVVDRLAEHVRLRFLVVGDGPGLAMVRQRAAETNARHSRRIVIVTGGLTDPRDAYIAADVVLGMGSSALKALAFGKPLVVQGARGYWRLLEESSIPFFLYRGWYGEKGDGEAALESLLLSLAGDASRRRALGVLGRALVVDRFSLRAAAEALESVYLETIATPLDPAIVRASLIESAREVAKFKIVRAGQELGKLPKSPPGTRGSRAVTRDA